MEGRKIWIHLGCRREKLGILTISATKFGVVKVKKTNFPAVGRGSDSLTLCPLATLLSAVVSSLTDDLLVTDVWQQTICP